MKHFLRNILILAASAACILSSCAKDDAEVIPRAKMVKIYAEMFETDQWILATQGIRLMADTSLVYEPILNKYGYDVNDYMKTVDSYMDDPERFAKVLRNTGEILDERMEGLRKTIQEMAKIARIPKIKVEYKPEEFSEYLFGKPYVHYYDSLGIEVDSLKGTYRLVDHETSDTTYDGIRMIIRDTLEVTDSLASIDSIVKPDTLSKLQKQALKIENKVIDKAKNLTKFKIAE